MRATRRARNALSAGAAALGLLMVSAAPVAAQAGAATSVASDTMQNGATTKIVGDGTTGWPPVATFSIVAYDPTTGEHGMAVQSRVFSVGNGVMWAEAGVGVVTTQAVIDVGYGPRGLALLREGLSADSVKKRLLSDDPDPNPTGWPKGGRQFSVIDATGNVATHTGPDAPQWSGHRVGQHVSAQGNILAGQGVVDSMVAAYERTEGHLSLRLMAALEAGQAAGGDTRGMQSAAMLVVGKNRGVWLNNDVVLRLQVDDSTQPIAELRRLVEIAATQRERTDRARRR